jgi:hypothetical protein
MGTSRTMPDSSHNRNCGRFVAIVGIVVVAAEWSLVRVVDCS